MTTSDAVCRTCNKPHGNGWNPVHPFNDGSAGMTAFLGKRGHRAPTPAPNASQRAPETPSTPVFPSDPVLRVALMAAGVITADDLRAAELSLTVAFNQLEAEGGDKEVRVGEPKVDAGTGTIGGEHGSEDDRSGTADV